MYSKRSGQGDGPVSRPVRTSDRLRRRPKVYSRSYLYYTPTIIRPKRRKTKTRTAASQIAKMLRPGNRPMRTHPHSSVRVYLKISRSFPLYYWCCLQFNIKEVIVWWTCMFCNLWYRWSRTIDLHPCFDINKFKFLVEIIWIFFLYFWVMKVVVTVKAQTSRWRLC